MRLFLQRCVFLLVLLPTFAFSTIYVGVSKSDITPPIGSPSAGYAKRLGGMEGIHDSLLAISLFIDNEEKQVVFCSVDHLGFTHDMVQAVIDKVHSVENLRTCNIYIASSHTHAGGGAYLDIPILAQFLTGPYNEDTKNFYIEKTAQAIIASCQNTISAKIGIGYGQAPNLSVYRSTWPLNVSPIQNIALIKVTTLDNTPLIALFNYPVHPTVLTSENRVFSADFIGYARDALHDLLGAQALYFNGAQGEILPVIFNDNDRFDSCHTLGQLLADTVINIWNTTETSDTLEITTLKDSYTFNPSVSLKEMTVPLGTHSSEVNVISLNKTHAFITIPGELSCVYDEALKTSGQKLGFEHVSVFGLTNDAHGYILTPEAYCHKTPESSLALGGEFYGKDIYAKILSLLKKLTCEKESPL